MSENENAAVTAVMNQVAAYADRMAAAFCLVHHTSKGNQANKSVVDTGAGAAAMARAADCHCVLREHETDGAVVMEASGSSRSGTLPRTLTRPPSRPPTAPAQRRTTRRQECLGT
jgi:RecA-family ATPase